MCLRRRFGKQEVELTNSSRIIVVESEGTKFGIVVDAVQEVAKVAQSDIDKAPVAVAVKGEFISGIYRYGQKITVILDVNVLVQDKGNVNELQG